MFVCTHRLGSQWKSAKSSPPSWVQTVMANGTVCFLLYVLIIIIIIIIIIKHINAGWPFQL